MKPHQTWVTQIEDELGDDRSLADQSRMLTRFVKKIQADALEHAGALCFDENGEMCGFSKDERDAVHYVNIQIRKAAAEVADPE